MNIALLAKVISSIIGIFILASTVIPKQEVEPQVESASIEVTASPTISPILLSTSYPTPTATGTPTIKPSTPKPTVNPLTPKPVIKTTVDVTNNSEAYVCNCSKTCPNMSCSEAQYQLKTCGCGARDTDKDGIACDSQCQ